MGRPQDGYRLPNGDRVPGTTTVIGRYKDTGALIQWAYKQGKEHQDLANRGLPGPKHLYDKVEKAAATGTLAHELIDDHICGRTPRITIDDEKALNAYKQFLQWKEQTKIEVVATEFPLVSEKLKFGGTPDGIGRMPDGRLVMMDWKTSGKVYSDHIIQGAAYCLLVEECGIPDLGKPVIDELYVLRVSKEDGDFAFHRFGGLENEKRSFILMRELYDRDATIQRRAK